jgi:N4-gp56 family major capsid protein
MPKNMGKTIKQYHYMPILDDRNMNSQGIDAAGALGALSAANFYASIKLVLPENVLAYDADQDAPDVAGGQAGAASEKSADSVALYFVGSGTNDATALARAKASLVGWAMANGFSASWDTNPATTVIALIGDITTTTVMGAGAMYTAGYGAAVTLSTVDSQYGRFYGSSKDVGLISGKIPAIAETGGRVNRVGMKRIELQGTIDKFGFFTEYSQESMDFDTDSELMMHLTQEVVKAANEMTEDQIQVDLLNAAGVVRYTGAATSAATLQGNDASSPFAVGNTNDALTYDDLVKLGIELDNNRCPKNTTLIAGSRMVDTKVVNAARYIYIGSELLPTIMRLTDYHGNKAFIPVAQYASAGTVARGEVGAVDNFRFIVVPEMMHWAAAGGAVTAGVDTVYRNSSNVSGALRYDVFPMLVVGEGSFTTIGFQTDGKSVKFQTKHVKPGDNHTTDDPYGETGFYSIKWFYGFMALRSERIALVKTIAEWG